MKPSSLPFVLIIAVAMTACAAPTATPPSQSPNPSATSVAPSSRSPASTPPASTLPSAASSRAASPSPTDDPTADGLGYRVTVDWVVPGNRVTVPHEVHAPIAPAPALPLPSLLAVYVGDRPEADPSYQRISFYFRGAFPEYNLQYVRSLTAEGSGATIPLEGNGVLRVGFVSAQAHDNAGVSTVQTTPTNPIGFQNLKSYASAGDFEGHVTYGLGIQVAPSSDQVLKIRAGEVEKPDGGGGLFYVVHVDIQTG